MYSFEALREAGKIKVVTDLKWNKKDVKLTFVYEVGFNRWSVYGGPLGEYESKHELENSNQVLFDLAIVQQTCVKLEDDIEFSFKPKEVTIPKREK